MSALADLLRDARKRLQLTQQDVADRLGVSRQAVTHWEQGRGIDLGNLVRIAEMLGLDLEHSLALASKEMPPTALAGFREQRNEYVSGRKTVSVDLDQALLDSALAEGIDLNACVAEALSRELLHRQRQRWEAENELAIRAYNDRIGEEGTIGSEYSRYG